MKKALTLFILSGILTVGGCATLAAIGRHLIIPVATALFAETEPKEGQEPKEGTEEEKVDAVH